MLTQEIRRRFLDYFRQSGHTIVPSSPVVPHDDPTLLFINAGMNQFKDVFLGESRRDYTRATSSQKCVRVGGKHNDLDNVGHTSRHLTLFEMLGNFSFGDYFKEESIRFSWEVSTEVFGYEPERIWPTVFRDDDEAFELWKKYVPEERITRFDEDENFWSMGDTGPCGPCSELLYDRGADYGEGRSPLEDPSGERFLEYWNLVFMQYNRDASGKMDPLPKPSIDTGAGLERVVSLKMGVDSVFETDLLRDLIGQIENVSGVSYDFKSDQAAAFRVIADHIRCLAFSIADGIQPSNVDRGYVLRKVLRRAVRYGRQLGMNKPFLSQVLPRLVDLMGEDYPELKSASARIAELLTLEEEGFLRTLGRGGNLLNQVITNAKRHGDTISGDDAFKLKDTYGLPLEEITLLAKDDGLTVNMGRYHELEAEAKERSRGARKETSQIASENLFDSFTDTHGATEFIGFDHEVASDAKVLAIVHEGQFVDAVEKGQEAIVVLDKTSFYAEMGGQVGDAGSLQNEIASFTVTDCQAPFKGIIGHIGTVSNGSLSVGDTMTAQIHVERRQKVANNHTATHLLHWALHQVLGEHVRQAGSVVDADRLRFDFSHHKGMTPEQIREVEDLVNTKIRENLQVKSYELPFAEAQKTPEIKQFFGEKYGAVVRVVDIDFSKELCGGTHTSAVGNIGLFRVAKESSIAAGVRRIEAVTGADAEAISRETEDQLQAMAALLKSPLPKAQEKLQRLLDENKQYQIEKKSQSQNAQKDQVKKLVSNKKLAGEIPFIGAQVEVGPKELRSFADQLMSELQQGVIAIAVANEGRCQLLIKVSDDLVGKGIKAGDLIKEIAPCIDGKGGGKADSAQAGGSNPEGITEAFSQLKKQLEQLSQKVKN